MEIRQEKARRTRCSRPRAVRTAGAWAACSLVAALAACGGEDGGTGPDGVTLADLVGSWSIDVWEYAFAADTTQKADWVVTKSLTGTLFVGTGGTFSVSPALDGGTGSDNGSLTVQGDSIYWDGQNDEEWVTFELDAPLLTVRWPETSFVDVDQNATPEDAWLRVVFHKQ